MALDNHTHQFAQDTTHKLFGDAGIAHEGLIELVDRNVSYKDDPVKIASAIAWKKWDGGSGHWFLGVDPKTGTRAVVGGQFRPLVPYEIPGKNGKKPSVLKYIGMRRFPAYPAFAGTSDPNYWPSVLVDPSRPVIVTEGMKKAMVAIASECSAISIPGVWCWGEKKVLNEWLKLFAAKGRTFFLAFDMDLFTNPKVLVALRSLGLALEKEGATVKVMLWDKAHKGLDDYLLHAGFSAIEPILRDALPLEDWWKKVSNKMVRAAEDIRSTIGSRLRYNDMSHQVELDGENFDLRTAKYSLEYHHSLTLPLRETPVAYLTQEVAKEDTYHPVRDYLEKVHTLYGDDTSILNDLAPKVLGAHDPLDQTFLVRWLISAVARAFEPGCKAENVFILVGKQGVGKSTFFRALASTPWFTDSVSSTSDPDALLGAHQFWIVEWAEVLVIFSKRLTEEVKSFTSRQEDTLRRPYGSGNETLKRSFIIGASSNDGCLHKDPSGARRFWATTVGDKIDTAFVEEHRDAIWAAAVALYKAGEQWWLTPEEEEQAREKAKDYKKVDPWEDDVLNHADGQEYVRTSYILEFVLKVPQDRIDGRSSARVDDILLTNGWVKIKRRFEGFPNAVWGFKRGPDYKEPV